MLITMSATATTVKVESSLSTAQAQYASRKLTEALNQHGYATSDAKADFRIALNIDNNLGAESFAIKPRRGRLELDGGDARGLIYAALSVSEQIGDGIAPNRIKASQEHPRLEFRAIKFNLPW